MKKDDTSPKISVTLITRNEERNIAACLETVLWADEIVVVDSGSSDKTVEIAQRYTDKVYVRKWEGQGLQKNRAVELAQGPWIFSIDADERVSPESAAEIRSVIVSPSHAAYSMRRKNFYRGQWIRHGGWWPDKVKRLFLKGEAMFNDAIIHDALELDKPIGNLRQPLLHYSFHSAGDFLERGYRYNTHQAHEMFQQGRRANAWTAISHALFKLFQCYVLRLGFLDGSAGILIAVSHSVGVFYRYYMLRELTIDEKNKKIIESPNNGF